MMFLPHRKQPRASTAYYGDSFTSFSFGGKIIYFNIFIAITRPIHVGTDGSKWEDYTETYLTYLNASKVWY
jgi:hypothetical protein